MPKKAGTKYSDEINALLDTLMHIEKSKESARYMQFLVVVINLVSENLDKDRLKGARYEREFRLDGLNIRVTYEKT